MRVTKGRPEDTEAIVALLKESLGESLMPKSASYWTWKHLSNPFGRSPVLLCWEDTKLIGIRAFMRWNWRLGGEIFSSVRAVDTATHPGYQGKGIFKKLTMALVEECTNDGVQFVFNTPNGQSKPGYLKMGWKEAGRLPIIAGLGSLVPGFNRRADHEADVGRYLSHPGLRKLVDEHVNVAQSMITALTPEYLRWRYLDVPVVKYYAVGVEEGSDLVALAFFRLKGGRLGNELRITDSFAANRQATKKIRHELTQFERKLKANVVTQSGLGANDVHQIRRMFDIRASRGPSVTIRDLQMKDLSAMSNFNNWSPSLGDLELF